MKNLVLILGLNELGKEEIQHLFQETLPCLKTVTNGIVEMKASRSTSPCKLEWFEYIDLGEVLRNTDDNWVLEHLATLATSQKVINTL